MRKASFTFVALPAMYEQSTKDAYLPAHYDLSCLVLAQISQQGLTLWSGSFNEIIGTVTLPGYSEKKDSGRTYFKINVDINAISTEAM